MNVHLWAEVGDVYNWWWGLRAEQRSLVALELGGGVGDAVLPDPPDYIVDAILYGGSDQMERYN